MIPVCNIFLIEYTFAWLEMNHIFDIIIVYSKTFEEKIKTYVDKRLQEKSRTKITQVLGTDC